MRHLIYAVRCAVQEKNWYAALPGALTIPDIAAKLDGGGSFSRARYVAWFDKYLLPTYTGTVGGQPHVCLTGNDCYALRCAYLHEGDFDITTQPAKVVLDRFEFVVSSDMVLHRNTTENLALGTKVLQLQVGFFCEQVCEAVEKWLNAREADPSVAAALARLPTIHFTG